MEKRVLKAYGYLRGCGLTLLGALALAGCQHQNGSDLSSGGQDGSPLHSGSQDPDLTVQNPSAALKTMLAAQVGCATPSDCASGVGLLLSSSEDETTVNRCSGFLIAPDVVATSAQCIPDDLQAGGADCGGRIRMAFPNGDGSSQNVGCDHVLSIASSASAPNLLHQQYAFIKLRNSVYHEFYHLTHDGMADRPANFSLIAVDASSQELPVVRSVSCPAVLNSALLLGQGSGNSPVLPVGCNSGRESAGGMLLGSSKNSRGIWYGGVAPEMIRAVQTVFTRHSSRTRLSWAGNLACIQTPIDPAQFYFSADCDLSIDPSQLGTALIGVKAGIVTQFSGEARAQLEHWAQSNKAIFQQWQLVGPASAGDAANSKVTELFAAPLCFARSDSDGWLKDYRNWLGIYSSSATLKFNIPVWTVNLSVDDHLAISGYVTSEGQSEAQLVLNPSQFHGSGQSQVYETLKSPQSGEPLSDSFPALPACN